MLGQVAMKNTPLTPSTVQMPRPLFGISLKSIVRCYVLR